MAFGSGTISDIGGAVSDIFAAKGDRLKAQGDRLEGQNYTLASQLALQNEEFTKQSTDIKEMQTQREIYKGLGSTQADVSGAGFTMGGSALDIMREGASQGALTKAVIGQQGLITEAGYEEQSKAYTNMAQAAEIAAQAEDNAAKGATVDAVIKGVAAVTSLFTGFDFGGATTNAGNIGGTAGNLFNVAGQGAIY